ncbi:hypothetical protein AC249_AIPGENE6667 [Exaiptasia diaphana]|nr:hypothetical protein AC249_AIPGENE6667 [Exaiptasia diaphana]
MSSLVELKPSLSGVNSFETDGEKTLQQGISQPCTKVKLLRCFGHFKTTQTLVALGATKELRDEILSDIFGYNIRETHHEGLVDSEDNDVFEAKLSSLKWGKELLDPVFYEWFLNNKAEDMKRYMLAPLRTEVGLGSPPLPYYQNNSECMNEVLKDQVKYKESELPDFVDKIAVIEERHKDLLRKAVTTTGEWELIPGFK